MAGVANDALELEEVSVAESATPDALALGPCDDGSGSSLLEQPVTPTPMAANHIRCRKLSSVCMRARYQLGIRDSRDDFDE